MAHHTESPRDKPPKGKLQHELGHLVEKINVQTELIASKQSSNSERPDFSFIGEPDLFALMEIESDLKELEKLQKSYIERLRQLVSLSLEHRKATLEMFFLQAGMEQSFVKIQLMASHLGTFFEAGDKLLSPGLTKSPTKSSSIHQRELEQRIESLDDLVKAESAYIMQLRAAIRRKL